MDHKGLDHANHEQQKSRNLAKDQGIEPRQNSIFKILQFIMQIRILGLKNPFHRSMEIPNALSSNWNRGRNEYGKQRHCR